MGSGSVTLELGGKSTRVIADEYPLDKAAARILLGKGSMRDSPASRSTMC